LWARYPCMILRTDPPCMQARMGLGALVFEIQEYLAHKKVPLMRTLQ
jgi:hypothetical protein